MNMIRLENKICVVTGASRGIGYAISGSFARAGATVVMAVRNPAQMDADLATRSNQGDGGFFPLQCDVTDPASVAGFFREVYKRFGRLDVLVANAGILEDALIGMVTPEQVNRVFAVNTFGVIYCSQYAARLMTRNKSGSIINIASIIGTNGNAGQAVYGGSKAAVIGITKSLAKELAASNIRVNAIAPGFIDTDMARSIPFEKFRERMESIAMKRIGTPEEVANVALFLASDLSSYVTGQTLGVDGGMLI
jgi:3-oxoacyl-[acyl-carrier protein] reductase